jgi:O-antigen/teichoic acid export membrane protein
MRSGTPEAGADVLSGPDIAGRVVRGGALRAIGFGVVNLLGILSSVVLLRHLGVSDFGRYGTVIALVAIVSGLADAGLNMTGSRELALLPRGAERRRLLGALLGVRLLLLVAAAVAALAFAAPCWSAPSPPWPFRSSWICATAWSPSARSSSR